MLKLCTIKKDYLLGGNPVPALKGVSIDFRDSEFVSILGPSGCGKTTLLNIIGGLDKYTSGDLVIDGVSTKAYKDRDWDAYRNHAIGFVFQNYNLISHQSVIDNVALAMRLSGVSGKERKRRAMEALASVGIADHAKKKPNQLSGGQMQRVAIARALVNNPRVILADEPTGALDTVTSVQIMEILQEVAKDRLVVMVTHNPELADKYSTRIIKLRDGEVIEDSNPIGSKKASGEVIAAGAVVATAGKGKGKKNSEQVKEGSDAALDLSTSPTVTNVGSDDADQSVKPKRKRTSMGYWTALKLSFKNLLTKKTRTILTAIAGSIGIIGIALILSISHGMNIYIDRMQREMLGQMPIQIGRTAFMIEQIGNQGDPVPGNVSPQDPFLPLHINIISQEFLDFLNEPEMLELTLDGDGVSLIYDLHPHILFNPSGTTVAYSLPSQRTGNLDSTRAARNIHPFRLPRETIINEFYDVVWENSPHLDPDAIGLTIVLNQHYRMNRDLLMLLFGNHNDRDFDEFEDIEFRLAFNQQMFAFDAGENAFVFNYSTDHNFYDRYNDTANTYPMYISRIIRNKGNNMMPMGTGIAFPHDLQEGIILPHHGTTDFHAQVLSHFTPGTDTWQDFLDLTRFIAGVQDRFTDEMGGMFGDGLTDLPPAMASRIFSLMADHGLSQTQLLEIFESVFGALIASFPASALGIGVDDLGLLDFVPNWGQAVHDDIMELVPMPTIVGGVSIYPASFESKRELQRRLDQWNVDNVFNEIHYNDFVEMLFGFMQEMIDAVAIVLIGVSAVSLIVSTLMIGIITYVSVLERTKEIGILRSLGARKKDVKRVFGAETVLIGLMAGVLGILVTLLLTIPLNIIIYHVVDVPNVAVVPWWGAIGLIVLSCVLTLVSGFIPSRIAAKRDPVVALRTE